jgi:biotin transport system substrate-specific component
MRTTLAPQMQPTLATVLWPSDRALRHAVLMAIGSVLLTLSAKVQIPFWPVPMTMQTYVVVVLGMAYGTRLGGATVLFYLAQGALGLPVLAGTPERGIGLAYMVGPTGGYLVGFVIAAALAGELAARSWDRGFARTLLAMALAHLVIFVPGVTWLATSIGWERAFAVGVVPFIGATVAKTLLGVVTMPLAWRLVGRHSRHQDT